VVATRAAAAAGVAAAHAVAAGVLAVIESAAAEVLLEAAAVVQAAAGPVGVAAHKPVLRWTPAVAAVTRRVKPLTPAQLRAVAALLQLRCTPVVQLHVESVS
jgi:hypothetical protein